MTLPKLINYIIYEYIWVQGITEISDKCNSITRHVIPFVIIDIFSFVFK